MRVVTLVLMSVFVLAVGSNSGCKEITAGVIESPDCRRAWTRAQDVCLTEPDEDGDQVTDYVMLDNMGISTLAEQCGSTWVQSPNEMQVYEAWSVCVNHDATITCAQILACSDGSEVCYDSLDNDGNGVADCADLVCCDSERCSGSAFCTEIAEE